MKSLTAITIISVAVMIMASAGYYFYNNSINESSYPSYHVDMHLNTTTYYPIHLNSNFTGNGTYQQLFTFSDPSHYGINTNGSNLAFYDGFNNTHLYAWIQSINNTSMQIWVKNYNASNVIDMQVLPSYENLFNATGYLGEAPQLSSTYAEYDNGVNVFNFYDNFAGTALKSDWSVNSSATVSVNNGLTLSSPDWAGIMNLHLINAPVIEEVCGKMISGDYGILAVGLASANSLMVPYSIGYEGRAIGNGTVIENPIGTERVMTNPVLKFNTTYIVTGTTVNSTTGSMQINYGANGTATDSTASISLPDHIVIGNYASTSFYQWVRTRTYISSMPTFTVGTFTNMTDASYLSNSITIPMPNWFNLTLKAYTNYSFTFHYNNTPLYFTYDGLINNTIYTGFLDSNLTLDIHFIALGYSGKTELIVGR